MKDRYNPWIGCPAKRPEQMWRLLFAQFYLNLSDEKICLAAYEGMAPRLYVRPGIQETPPRPKMGGGRKDCQRAAREQMAGRHHS